MRTRDELPPLPEGGEWDKSDDGTRWYWRMDSLALGREWTTAEEMTASVAEYDANQPNPIDAPPAEWEHVAHDTDRLKVPGGWLYRVFNDGDRWGDTAGWAICFVPEPRDVVASGGEP